ncbi:MAG: signal peptidase II [Acholeplasma sp.]|nr:signal peptidase II [Acholeplasma sp.]
MLLGYIIIIGLVFLDQIVKLISFTLSNGVEMKIATLIPNVLEFEYLENTGASFGMLKGHQDLFSLITIFALIVFGYLFVQVDLKKKKFYSYSIILLIAGTFGNAIDRLFNGGKVIDMINMPILNTILSWVGISPFVFNLADLYMNVAIVMFIIDLLFLEKKREKKNDETIELA